MAVIRNSQKWWVFRQKPEVHILISGWNKFSWYYKGDLMCLWRFYFKIEKLRFRRFWKSLPVTTGSNADTWKCTINLKNLQVYNPWKFHWIIFSRFGDHSRTKLLFKKRKWTIYPDRKCDFQKSANYSNFIYTRVIMPNIVKFYQTICK
jgi:hypothetical protein